MLADWVRSAYKPIFQYADLSDVQKVTDQFRHYEPIGMRGRMVSLFFGLCKKAGLVEKAPTVPRTTPSGGSKPPKPAAPKPPKAAADPTPPSVDPPAPTTAARDRYVNFLLEKAAASDEIDADLLDRIERALGIGGVTS